ncbi:hypothetical protein D3C85_1260300 [compost metagenome]
MAAETTDARDTFQLDLSKAYTAPTLEKLVRSFEFDKQVGKLTLVDTFDFRESGAAVTERFVTLHKPIVVQAGEIRLEALVAGSTNQQLLRYDAAQLTASIHTAEHPNHEGTTELVYLIDLDAAEVGEQVRIEVSLELA